MNTNNEKGMAMIMTLIFVAVLAAMAVSFMFLSQAETWSTMNYRFMNQARDGAEAGINVAANHILNNQDAVLHIFCDKGRAKFEARSNILTALCHGASFNYVGTLVF